MTKTVNDLYLEIKSIFAKNDIPSPTLCARELCAFSTGRNKDDITNWAYTYVFDEEVSKAMNLVQRHLDGEPLAYILGEWDFYDMTFKVTPDVLIPRADTESLVEYALKKADEMLSPKILDLCCGTGCIGIILAKHIKGSRAISVDVSEGALEVARKNSRTASLGARHIVAYGDVLLEDTTRFGKLDMIIANPPYIPSDEVLILDKSVKEFEPHLALDGGQDGLNFYRAISKNFKKNLNDNGYIMFEVGKGQHLDVADILYNEGYTEINIIEDLTGVQRIVCAQYKERK